MAASGKLLSKVAHFYFSERLTMAQIGERLSMSRHRAGRLLREAEEQGIVRIEIREPVEGEADLERRLEQAFGLKLAQVVNVADLSTPDEIKRRTTAAGAELLRELVQDGDVIGVGWGSSTFSMVDALDAVEHANTKVVQITGGNKWLASQFDCQEVTRRLAAKFGTRPVLLHAPCIVDRRETRELLMKDSTIRETSSFFKKLDIAVVGIGSIVPEQSSALLSSGYIPSDEIEPLIDSGAVGDVFSYFIDGDGQLVRADLLDRLITIGIDEIKRIPTSLAIATGAVKAKAVIAAVLGGFVNALILDSKLAEAVLREVEAKGISRNTGR